MEKIVESTPRNFPLDVAQSYFFYIMRMAQ